MKLTQFSIPLDDSTTIHGEYEGTSDPKRVVIFAHGFGVKRDSWGMFNELGDILKDDYLIVRFDFVEIHDDENATKVFPLTKQAKMLDAVISYMRAEFDIEEVSIIAHSQGCLVTGLLSPENTKKVILLASPVESPYSRMKQYFAAREGTDIDENGLSRIKRSDGSWTLVESGFWKDIKAIQPSKLYAELAVKTDLYFVRATQDHVITDKNFDQIQDNQNITYIELPGDHNFANGARKGWLDAMVGILGNRYENR